MPGRHYVTALAVTVGDELRFHPGVDAKMAANNTLLRFSLVLRHNLHKIKSLVLSLCGWIGFDNCMQLGSRRRGRETNS